MMLYMINPTLNIFVIELNQSDHEDIKYIPPWSDIILLQL